MDSKEYDSLLGVKRNGIPYPKSIFFIFITEFCERFSYHGMRTVLTLYLVNALRFSDNHATVIYHIFVMFCYISPLFGAYIADSVLGKFRTIFYLSIVYAIGSCIISLAAIPVSPLPRIPFSLLGLGLIALGTGGIKPCVSAFGGDQFQIPGQEKALEQYFFIFYFTVNLGSTLSTFITPIFREDVSCFGADCFPLAFGVPAALMITALVIFVSGKSFYKMRMPETNICVKMVKCMAHAFSNRNSDSYPYSKNGHWLDKANDQYEQEFIEEVKRLLSVLMLFIPLPIFWALFDQQGSQWTLQATRMNGKISDFFTVKPDQMQFVNSLLVVLLIPIFERFIYPLLAKCNILKKPLQRMTLGGFLVSLSFVLAAIVELQIEPTYPAIPGVQESSLNFVNTLPCPLTISLSDTMNSDSQFPRPPSILLPFENIMYNALPAAINYSVSIEPYNQSESCLLNGQVLSYREHFLTPESRQSLSILITANDKYETSLLIPEVGDDLEKSQHGNAKIRVIFTGLPPNENYNITLESLTQNYDFVLNATSGATNTIEILPGRYLVRLRLKGWKGNVNISTLLNMDAGIGGSYLLTLFPEITEVFNNSTRPNEKTMMVAFFGITSPNSVHMLLQLPQYIIITLGELLFAVTGYDFSFSQASNSMKTVMQSVWLLTNAMGNLIVILVVTSNLFKVKSIQFFFFAGLMFISFLVFTFLADRYISMKIQPSSLDSKYKRKEKDDSLSMSDFD